jgi:DNA-binding response OmpR family regulator
MLLREAGYLVTTVVGSDAGMEAAESGKFTAFIVGHLAPEPERLRLIRWLKQKFPKIPVIALHRSHFSGRQFGEADCVVNADKPEQLLQGISECLRSHSPA